MGSEVPGDRGVAMGSRVRWAVFLWLVAVPCGAAEVVVPGRYASVAAPSYTLIPFGRMGSVRLQQLYEGFLFPAGPVEVVGLAVRPDQDGTAPAKAFPTAEKEPPPALIEYSSERNASIQRIAASDTTISTSFQKF